MIFLIRHGETVGNASRTVQLPDSPLSPRGIAQAERLAGRLARESVARILSSDLARAAAIARIIQGVTGAPLTWEPLLHERNRPAVRPPPPPAPRAHAGLCRDGAAHPDGARDHARDPRIRLRERRLGGGAAAPAGHLRRRPPQRAHSRDHAAVRGASPREAPALHGSRCWPCRTTRRSWAGARKRRAARWTLVCGVSPSV